MEDNCSAYSKQLLHDFHGAFDQRLFAQFQDDSQQLVVAVQQFHDQFLRDQKKIKLLNRRIEELEEEALKCKDVTRKLDHELKDARSQFAAQLEENRLLKLRNGKAFKAELNQSLRCTSRFAQNKANDFSQEATQTSDDCTTGSEENLLEQPRRLARLNATPKKRATKRRSRSVHIGEFANSTSAAQEITPKAVNYQISGAIRAIADRSQSIENLDSRQLACQHVSNVIDDSILQKNKPIMRVGSRRNWTYGRPIEERQHKFVKASIIKMTTCDFCYGPIYLTGRASLRCSDCQQFTHEACKAQLSIPCVPRAPKTPMKNRMDGVRIQDYCPASAPMIPYPIIHCVVALERRGALNQDGLYRVAGKKQQAIRLLQLLKTSRGVPKMDLFENDVIADCIKDFLREFRDPLIPRTSRTEFIEAATKKNHVALNKAIADLPQPHRDTLAFLCIHWQKVVARKDANKMSVENLARFVSQSVLGPDLRSTNIAATHLEARRCVTLLVTLLSKATKEWEEILNPMTSIATPSVYSKEFLHVDVSILGPITNDDPSDSPTPKRARQKKLFDDPF
ncbi:unnamed protein product, partial [Mesorhabditis belari]|uniref:Rac GTPase-activating protein 1 n=1 Tax=Mesorhabditis belari TaxID=2138241 RepID=A0AAF3F5Q0_9BILA